MPSANILRETKIVRTPRVLQLEGIFDIPPSERSAESWNINFELPEKWNVGVVVGPSGSGKTTLINELWHDNVVGEWEWDNTKSLLDSFPKRMPIKEILSLLSSVGFNSPPSWVRPYSVLSNGEKFRVHIARTLAEMPDMAVVDEYSSVVDRTVAQIGSAAIQKTVRKLDKKLIAVSCHYDILDWLEPDWVYQPHTNELYTGRWLYQRPTINFEVRRVHHSAWKLFGRFHYLDEGLNKSAKCFVAYLNDTPVAFCAVLFFPHPKSPGWRFHRLVVLPDYQGLGIGIQFADYLAALFASTGKPVTRILAHPAVIHSLAKSPVWKMTSSPNNKTQTMGAAFTAKDRSKKTKGVATRLRASFKYIGRSATLDEVGDLLD